MVTGRSGKCFPERRIKRHVSLNTVAKWQKNWPLQEEQCHSYHNCRHLIHFFSEENERNRTFRYFLWNCESNFIRPASQFLRFIRSETSSHRVPLRQLKIKNLKSVFYFHNFHTLLATQKYWPTLAKKYLWMRSTHSVFYTIVHV